ncbi:MAG: histidine phosphatase family protein [Clostridia bacterium]|nr:histidine phosphatase family protein [Clostridia bacterium]
MKTTIYLVRHCEATGNVQRICHGITDSDITDNGRSQLECLTKRFEDVALDCVYSSHLFRAQETARAIIRNKEIPHHVDERLSEIHVGEWENIPWKDLPALYPEQSENWSYHPEKFAAPKGESMVQMYSRMKDALNTIIKSHEGKTIAVVSHGCAVRNALCWAHGWDVSQLSDVSWGDNTSVSKIEVDEEGVHLVFENDCSHLSEDLSTINKQNWWKTGEFE